MQFLRPELRPLVPHQTNTTNQTGICTSYSLSDLQQYRALSRVVIRFSCRPERPWYRSFPTCTKATTIPPPRHAWPGPLPKLGAVVQRILPTTEASGHTDNFLAENGLGHGDETDVSSVPTTNFCFSQNLRLSSERCLLTRESCVCGGWDFVVWIALFADFLRDHKQSHHQFGLLLASASACSVFV